MPLEGASGELAVRMPTLGILQAALCRAGEPGAEISQVTWEKIATGYSGAQLRRAHLTVNTPGASAQWRTRLVVKQIPAAGGWLGWATEDSQVREVQLWRAGIFSRLPRGIESGALVAAQQLGADGAVASGTLVMRDARAHLLRRPYCAPPSDSPLLRFVLDAVARLHTAFWQDRFLLDPQLGLMPPEPALSFAAPQTIARRLATSDRDPYLQDMPAAWEAFFAHIPGRAADTLSNVQRNPTALIDVLGTLPFTLIHGDVWGPNLGVRRLSPRWPAQTLVLLDWGLASAAPCTYDPLWLSATWPTLHAQNIMAQYRARLEIHLRRRGTRLSERTWRRLLDTGYLRTVLAGGEAFGRAIQQAPTPPARRRAEAVAVWWATRAADGARRLGAG